MATFARQMIAIAFTGICAIHAQSWAQTETTATITPSGNANSFTVQPGRLVLLREGSTLVQTTGTMRRAEDGRWMFVIESPRARSGAFDLVLLPCATLEEMERVAASAEGDEPNFQTTGEVYVYDNKNYFLPTHSPHLVSMARASEAVEEDEAPAEEGAGTDEAPAETSDDDAPIAEGDSVDDIMSRLEERAGPVARSTAPTNIAVTGEGASLSPAREGTMVLDRRGNLTRGANGEWVFVFDADAEGLADPPAVVLPCQMLERMQLEARNAGNVMPMLITGRVFEYHNRSYILPTLYRTPRERTVLVP